MDQNQSYLYSFEFTFNFAREVFNIIILPNENNSECRNTLFIYQKTIPNLQLTGYLIHKEDEHEMGNTIIKKNPC
jgi:hypothetical protein